MHKSARLVTTAGATVLTFAAMSGVAQADPVGDLTGGLTDTVGGVVNSATGGAVRISRPSRPAAEPERDGGGDPAVGAAVEGPVHADARLQARSSPDRGTQINANVNAGVRSASGQGDAISTGIGADVDTCGLAPAECGEVAPPSPPSPGPSAPPPATPPVSMGPPSGGPLAPGATGSAAEATLRGMLPVTGGQLGTLTGVGLLAVLTGAAAMAGSRIRTGRDSQ